MIVKLIASMFVICSFFLSVSGQTKINYPAEDKSVTDKSSQFFPLSALREGMKGTALTVFQGNKPESFNVEILGLIPGAIGPKQDMIVGRISGGGADRTHVFAGMSGSPVFIDGKLVGAIAYAFPFSKEAICGITPISQMVEIFEQNRIDSAGPRPPKSFSFEELVSDAWKPQFPEQNVISGAVLSGSSDFTSIRALAGQSFQRIATPMIFSGFSQATLNHFAPQLVQAGLIPVSTVGGSSKIGPLKKADENTLVGGDSVVMQLARGDISLSAAGTVTLRDGDKVYAFGHPFLNLGSSNLPMSESHVITVVPNVSNSFKLAVPDAMVGSMTQDRATGVFGRLGKVPNMIPVELTIRTSRNVIKKYSFEVAKDDFLTPLLVNIGVYNSIVSNERALGSTTIELAGRIKLSGGDAVDIERRFAGPQASQIAASAIVTPVAALLQSRFDDLVISGIEVSLKATDEASTARLERIGVNRAEVRAGEVFEVEAFVRTDTGRVYVQKIPVKIPADTPTGTLSVTVGDGSSLQLTSPSTKFVPKNVDELVKLLNEIKKNDRLYVQTHRVTKGAVIGANELPNLPPSVLATINNSRTVGGFHPTVQSILTDQEIAPADFLIFGKQTLDIEVVK